MFGWCSGPSETEPEVWALATVTEVTGAGKSQQYTVAFDDGRQEKLSNKQVALMIYYYGTSMRAPLSTWLAVSATTHVQCAHLVRVCTGWTEEGNGIKGWTGGKPKFVHLANNVPVQLTCSLTKKPFTHVTLALLDVHMDSLASKSFQFTPDFGTFETHGAGHRGLCCGSCCSLFLSLCTCGGGVEVVVVGYCVCARCAGCYVYIVCK